MPPRKDRDKQPAVSLLEGHLHPLYSRTKDYVIPVFKIFPGYFSLTLSSSVHQKRPPTRGSWSSAALRGSHCIWGGRGAAPRDEIYPPMLCSHCLSPVLLATQGYHHPVVLEERNKLKRFIKICPLHKLLT